MSTKKRTKPKARKAKASPRVISKFLLSQTTEDREAFGKELAEVCEDTEYIANASHAMRMDFQRRRKALELLESIANSLQQLVRYAEPKKG